MGVETVAPETVVVSEYNERQSFEESDLDGESPLVKSVEQSGVIQPPLVLETDGEYRTFVGQRRVRAAQIAGIDEIPVIVMDKGEQEALAASITENMNLLSEEVSPKDRALAIERLWEAMGGDGTPVFSHVANELGVSPDTVRTWYEPLRDEWEDTVVDPTTDESEEFFDGDDSLGERSLGDVRRMTDDSDEAEEVARLAASAGATQAELDEAKGLVEDTELSAEAAVRRVTDEAESEDESSTSEMQVDVTFEGNLSSEVQAFANREGLTTEEVIERAVKQYVGVDEDDRDNHGSDDDSSTEATPLGDRL